MKRLLALILVVTICGCGFSTPSPAWKDNAHRQLDAYTTSFLIGREASTEPHFSIAGSEIAAGNDLALLAIAYLAQYALHTACLEGFDASAFAKIYRLEPHPSDMAYCHFLKGNFSAVDIKALPVRYAGVLKAASGRDLVMAAREILTIDDALSRLIACGVCVRYLPSDEAIIQIGISIASANEWRRPLRAYLIKLQAYHMEKGDINKAAAALERLRLLKND